MSSGSPSSDQARSTMPLEDEAVQAFTAKIAHNRQRAAEEKLRRVNRVLRRAQVSKAANLLRKRLEYAKFKIRNGWTTKSIGEVQTMYSTLKPSINPIKGEDTVPRNDTLFDCEEDPSVAAAARCLVGCATRTPEQSPRQSSHHSDLTSLLTSQLREGPNAYFAKLGIPSVHEPTAWNAYLKIRDSRHPYFPSPAPSPPLSRETSPPLKSLNVDAQEGAILLMMLQEGKKI